MNEILSALLQSGDLSPLSYFFSHFIADRYEKEPGALLTLSAALVSQRNQQGDVCIDLQRLAGRPMFDTAPESRLVLPTAPALNQWLTTLQQEQAVGQPGDIAPLILDGTLLYLGRFWHYEKQLQLEIEKRLETAEALSEERLKKGLERLFPANGRAQGPDWQRLASALAVSRRFAVISGGPGTGKTTTVVKVLALLLEQDSAMHIRLIAPTGKAAARLAGSIRASKDRIDSDDQIRAAIPEQAATIHRLLGFGPRGFRHHRGNPLVLDCLVVDEASMIDLSLMARLLDALPDQARIILLGDRDQLASVEAGSVLGDITGHGQPIRYSPAQAQQLSRLSGIPGTLLPVSRDAPAVAGATALLHTSYRFRSDSGIGRLAKLVNAGQGAAALELARAQGTEAGWIESPRDKLARSAIDWAIERFSHYLKCERVEQALRLLEETRLLCALHQGPFGAVEANRMIAEGLAARGLTETGDEVQGKPVMITVNDYESGLYNGDIGLLWHDDQGRLRAWFRLADDRIRDIPVRSLPGHVPAWALSVHKSQGSEFRQVLLILPWEENSPVVNRELIYTGITRAIDRVIIHSSPQTLISGCRRSVERSSGLAAKLGWG
jgi:exodeoxyribonuclease V alpha subunit